MGDTKKDKIATLNTYAKLIERQAGRIVRPYNADGYVNMMTKYGTSKDASEQYVYQREPVVPDELLTTYYEGNGLFAKIIDAPAEEALKHGFHLDGINDQKIEDFYRNALDELDWEETATTGLRWARLFGGSIAVMLINDGRGLEEPLNWRSIKSIDDIRVYDRSLIRPDYASMFSYDPDDPFGTRGSRLGMPEWYDVYSRYGNFRVHDSRVLTFQNGLLPENTSNTEYQLWGMPEYVKIKRALRDVEVSHGTAPKLLDRSVQAIYKMKDLANELATEDGEEVILKRLQVIDMARSWLNSIAIDSEGEDYSFRQFTFTGASEIINATCNFLSALTSIPQTVLFGRSPAGMNATGTSDLENWYSYVERYQKRLIRKNLRYLLSIIFQAGLRNGEIDEIPPINIVFEPLWTLSEQEQATLEATKAQAQATRAATAATYVNMGAVDPSEIRKNLAKTGEFDIEEVFEDESDEEFNEIMEKLEQARQAAQNPIGAPDMPTDESGVEEVEPDKDTDIGGNAPAAAPASTKLPEDKSEEELAEAEGAQEATKKPKLDAVDVTNNSTTGDSNADSVGVLVVSRDGILVGTRKNGDAVGTIGGPGGHVEPGETLAAAAIRETQEEFGITPRNLIQIGLGVKSPNGHRPMIYLCTEYDGTPKCDDNEMTHPVFRKFEDLENASNLFEAFKNSLKIAKESIYGNAHHEDGTLVNETDKWYNNSRDKRTDGGPGSGNFEHKGVKGQLGGSAPSNKNGCSHPAAAFSPERRKAAAVYQDSNDADDALRDTSGKLWQSFDDKTRHALTQYTSDGYWDWNAFLRGTTDLLPVRDAEKIQRMTDAIGKSELPHDMVVFRGTGASSLASLLDLDDPKDLADQDLLDTLPGKTFTDPAFLSCGTTESTGWEKAVQLRIYCPKGTKGIYAEPFSDCGDGAGERWDERSDGKTGQSTFSSEMETILQRGTKLRITKAESTGASRFNAFIIDCEVVSQHPEDLE